VSTIDVQRGFIAAVTKQCHDDPGARAALRSALGKPYDKIPDRAHRYVIKAGAPDLDDDQQRAYYTVAAMIAAVPRKSAPTLKADGPADSSGRPGRSLGQCMAEAVGRGELRASTAEGRIGLLVYLAVTAKF